MAARYTAGESAAWNHSPLAGALWEAGTRSARAILLSENACKNMFDGKPTLCQLPPVTTDTRPGGTGNLKPNQKMKQYLAELNDGGKSASFDTMEDALAYIAKNFQTEANDLGTWEDEDGRTLLWMTQEDADEAEDNSDVIATITENDQD
jgi:hypothetical protein